MALVAVGWATAIAVTQHVGFRWLGCAFFVRELNKSTLIVNCRKELGLKRNWEIIRAILLNLEDTSSPIAALTPDKMPEYPEQEVAYNMRLLDQGGYVKGNFVVSHSGDGAICAAIVKQITNSGHDLLDTIRNDSVWSKTKDTFESKGLDMTIDLVISVGKKIMESILLS